MSSRRQGRSSVSGPLLRPPSTPWTAIHRPGDPQPAIPESLHPADPEPLPHSHGGGHVGAASHDPRAPHRHRDPQPVSSPPRPMDPQPLPDPHRMPDPEPRSGPRWPQIAGHGTPAQPLGRQGDTGHTPGSRPEHLPQHPGDTSHSPPGHPPQHPGDTSHAHGLAHGHGHDGHGHDGHGEKRSLHPIRWAVVTLSDRGARGERSDLSGPRVAEILAPLLGAEPVERVLLPDEPAALSAALVRLCDTVGCHLVVTTGGTGLTPRDRTPEATKAVIDREIPGMAEAVRAVGLRHTPLAMLSRAVCGLRGTSLIVNLSGSPRAVAEQLAVLAPVLPHAIALAAGGVGDCARP